MVNRAVALKMKANNWSLDSPPEMDSDCRDYMSLAASKIGNDQRRSRLRRRKFRTQEDETLLGDSAWIDVDRCGSSCASRSGGYCGPSPLLMAPGAVCGFHPQAGARSEPGFLGRYVGHSGPKTSALGSPVRGAVWKCAGPSVGAPLLFGTHQSKPPPRLSLLV